MCVCVCVCVCECECVCVCLRVGGCLRVWVCVGGGMGVRSLCRVFVAGFFVSKSDVKMVCAILLNII